MKRPLLLLSVGSLALSACANPELTAALSADAPGFATVAATTRAATGRETVLLQDAAAIRANADRVHAMIHRRTVSADTAVQVALLNNRGLQAAYADLGLTAAEIWQGTMSPNPALSVGLTGLGLEGLAARTIEGLISANLLALATRERSDRIAAARFEQAQLRAVEETLRIAHDTRLAWIDAVAAFEAGGLMRQAEGTAEAQADLAVELGRTGYLNEAGQAADLALHAELSGQRARARLDAQIAKERLTRLMGLWGSETEYFVPNALPGLPGRPRGVADIEARALQGRVDLALARLELQAVAEEGGLSNATRFVSDIDLVTGFETEFEDTGSGVASETSPDVALEFAIPIFDSGEARRRRAEQAYLRAAHQLAERAVSIRSEARAAQAELSGTHQIARHYRDTLVPLRTQFEAETLRAYNGMIETPAELLDAIRGRLDAQLSEAAARADYWRADAGLTAALYGGGDGAPAGGGGGAALASSGGGAGH